ncbi:MAG: ADP-ribosylation factor-like protein [Candidatus Odinarchaeota archaeon]
MKLSLLGLGGSGKTSIYATTLGGSLPSEVKELGPTVMYEVRNHDFLGIQVSLFDFGGQEKYRTHYLESPKVLAGTDILVYVIDLHDPDRFEEANNYLSAIISAFEEMKAKPELIVLLHKYDTEEKYDSKKLDKNVEKAKTLPSITKFKPTIHLTSIYHQEKLSSIFREILLKNFESLKKSVEGAEKYLAELKSRVIIADVSGNVITHNVKGFSRGLQLREDLRDFISSCNTLRENFFMVDSAVFNSKAGDTGKSLDLHIFSYILAVLIMGSEETKDKPELISAMLADMKVFAELAVEASER